MKKQLNGGKKITIDELGRMVADGFREVRQDLRNVEVRLDKKINDVHTGLSQQIKGTNSRIDDVAEKKVSVKDFEVRIVPIEKKLSL